MARKKVNLAYITSDSKRKATFTKRKKGLIKKTEEISILCGIEACTIIFSPNDPQPEVWPSPLGVQNVLSKFREMSELEQSKKMLNQESFLKERISKAQEQLKKQRNENKKKEMTILMFQYLNAGQMFGNVSMNDLNALSSLIDQNLKEIDENLNRIQTQEVVENGVGNVTGKEQACMDHAQVLETNVDAMEVLETNVHAMEIDFTNNNGGGLPFEDVNVPNGLWPNP